MAATSTNLHNSYTELYDRIEANSGLIFVNTYEEERLVRELKRKFSTHSIQFWSCCRGLVTIDVKKKPDEVKFHAAEYAPSKCRTLADGSGDTKEDVLAALNLIESEARQKAVQKNSERMRHIYVLFDADKFFANPVTYRYFRDIVYLVSTSGGTIICTGPGIQIPPELQKDASMIDLGLPTFDEIRNDIIGEKILKLIKNNNRSVENKERKGTIYNEDFDIDKISNACLGLTQDEIINTAAYSLTVKHTLDLDMILQEKKQIISKNDILEFWNCPDDLSSVGGFDNLKEWFKVQMGVMDNAEAASAYHCAQPKGMMILGVQGSGKTFIAKAIARQWGKGIIKLDMGRVFAGLVGESEKRMRMALAQAEAAGGVIIIDEIDKGLAGAAGSDRTDGGTTKRVIGTLLTWMQEEHPGLLIVATANDISQLIKAHPELFRSGRLDKIWFSDVPTIAERKNIFSIHLAKKGRDPKKFDLDKLANIKYKDKFDYTGAEIEHAIKESIAHVFARNLLNKHPLTIGGKYDIKTEDIITHLEQIKPITMVAAGPINSMRRWAETNASNVSKDILKTISNDNSINEFDSVPSLR